MNRYQQEVAEMDRRHRIGMRALSFGGAACLAVLALWAADLPVREWLSVWSDRAARGANSVPKQIAMTASAADKSTSATQVQADAGNASSIASSPQRLHLISTSPGRSLHEGTARIGTNPQNPQTYVAGAILVNGARLAEIHSDRVVLERGKEQLTLFAAKSARGKISGGSADLATVPAMPRGTSARPELLGVDSFGEVIRAMPYYEDDILRGLQVVPGRAASTFAQLGLKPNDVIVAIDSVAVTDSQNALEYLQALTRGAAISVRVRRGSATHTLSLDGSLIAPDQARNFQ